MSKSTATNKILASLSGQLTEEKLAEVRSISGIGVLMQGALTELVKDQPYCIEDIVTLLLSGWIMQTEEIKQLRERVSELEDVCDHQRKAIDEIADRSMRLRSLLSAVLPDQEPISSFDILKKAAAYAETRSSKAP